jgi:hypothetical protein
VNATDHSKLPIHPLHLQDLRKNGLTDKTILEAGIYSCPPGDINKILGPFFSGKVSSVLVFPYPGCNGYERYKLFPAIQTDTGTVKYYQAPKTGCALYIPPGCEAILQDVNIPLYITEGEKKGLKAWQEKIPCVSIGGLWNWSDATEEKKLISDFDRISLQGRTVYVVPDNDWEQPDRHGEPKNLRQAVYDLAYRLIDRGAKPFVVELPPGPEKGLDDFLCHHSVDEFHALPKRDCRKYTIEEMIQEASLENLREILKRLAGLPETERAIYINALAEKLKIPKRAIQKDIESLFPKKEESPDIDRLLECGANPQSNFSAQNFVNGILSFGAILGKERVLVQSDGQIILADGSNGDSFRFKRSSLTAEGIKRFRAGEDVDGRDLLNRIETLFSDHVIFRDARIPTLLGVWTLGTYFFKVFRFYGYLWVNSPVKRCGKSLVLDILSLVCFNSTPRLVNPSEASVFREVDSNDATLIIDEVESLSNGDKDQKSELISLINSGFQKGSQASRVETKGKEFVVVYFNAYGPKVMAGIKSVTDTIEDRSFKIPMARKIKTETVKRFNLRVLDSKIESIKQDCFIWSLRHADDVSEVYQGMTDVPGTESFDDRLKDILEPLVSIGAVIDAEGGSKDAPMVRTLIGLARDLGQGRDNQEALSESIPAVVNVMQRIIDGVNERFVSADDLFSKFHEDEDLAFIESKKALALFLAKLSLHRTPPKWVEGKTVRGYVVTTKWVEDLRRRYV